MGFFGLYLIYFHNIIQFHEIKNKRNRFITLE